MSNTKNKKNIFYNDFKPDFLTLIKEFPELKKYILKYNEDNEEEFQFDWSNNELSLLMDKSILNYYFNIKYYDIPKGFLIPPIPSRINYINLINSIITKLIKDINIKNIIGIDIGTGANIIYPILGYSIYKWKFICTEINKEAYNNAKLILQKNNLENTINIIKQNNKDNIFISILNRENKYIFSMCNPPYYNYENEIKLEDKKRDNEYNFDEIYYKNGEYGFFQRYFEESICYKNNVFLYTILIGKKINAENIYDKLSSYSDIIKIYNMQKILTGNNVRYIIYWSFFNNYKDFNNIKLYSNKYNKFRPIIKY
jgi:23S rRNA (adenine1618-N6)-methyltransferase